MEQLSEGIDTIGFICFYKYNSFFYKELENCYYKNNQNDLIKWKIIRAMSGFKESEYFLQEQKDIIKNSRLEKEIERSLRLIQR